MRQFHLKITKTSKQTMTDCPNINCNPHIHWWKQSQGVRKKIKQTFSLCIYLVLDNWALLREQGSSWKVGKQDLSVFKAWKETACLSVFGLDAWKERRTPVLWKAIKFCLIFFQLWKSRQFVDQGIIDGRCTMYEPGRKEDFIAEMWFFLFRTVE